MTPDNAPPVEFFDHQRRFIERARGQRRLALFADPGVGKTITLLGVMDERRTTTLVVAPRSVMRAAWESDAEKFPGLDVRIYHGPKRKGVLHGVTESTVIVTTFETFRRDAKALRAVGFGRFVIDESSKIKNKAAAVTRAAITFADSVDEVYLLSGTPAPNGPDEYWPQLRCLDPWPSGVADAPGAVGGREPIFYRWAGFYLRAHQRRIPGRVKRITVGYSLRPDREDGFNTNLLRVAVRIRKDDCLDLPEKVEQVVRVDLDREDGRAYLDLESGASFEEGDRAIEVQVSALARKLHQVVGGNVRDAEGEWHALDSSKEATFVDLVEALPPGEPFLVWTQYRPEAERLEKTIGGLLEIPVGRCDGSVSGSELDANLRAFKAGSLRALVCHPKSVGHGVTLTRCGDRPCRTAFFYSLGYSWEDHAQAMDRIHRAGQTARCLYYYLVARDTIDEEILAAVRNKADASRRVIDALLEKRGIAVGGGE